MRQETTEEVEELPSMAGLVNWRNVVVSHQGESLVLHPEAATGSSLHPGMRLLSMIRAYFRSSPVPIRTVLLAAGLLSTIFVFTSFIGRTQLGTNPSAFDWWVQAPGPFLNFFTWALLLPLINRWAKRWSLNTRPFWKPFTPLFSYGLLMSIAHELFTTVLYMVLLHYSDRMPWRSEMLGGMLLTVPAGFVQRFLEYWMLLLLLRYMEARREIRAEQTRVLQLQNELQTTQLLALKKQLQPHFLFNTLNTVSALMEEDPKSARIVLSKLGHLLRSTLDEERKERVPLIHEIDHIENYLGIETIRFKDRLQVQYDIPVECQNALVPGMVFQPLVENSIKHGLDTVNAEVCIRIDARREGRDLILSIRDNGRGCADVAHALARGGIGLRNVRERLSLLHGPSSRFQVASEGGTGFHVMITLPFETKE